MNFVKIPYLPEKKARVAVADIKRKDIEIIAPCHTLNLPTGLKRHADLSFCYLGDGKAVCAKGSFEYYTKLLSNLKLEIIQGETVPDKHYPLDAAYNVAIVGKKIFCKKDSSDKVLLEKAEEMGYNIININQGYGKCSVCPIDEKSAISADVSFAKAAEKEGIEVLLITNDTIILPGYSNGFFGGCAYMEDKNTLAVKGDLHHHPDCEKILAFLEKKDITLNCTETDPLFDFGSFIPIMEE